MFAKLFSRITESSLMEEPLEVRYVFVMLLAMCDPTGHVIGTDVAIARRMNMPLSDFQRCAATLMRPDPDSNSKEHEGRRIIPSEGERGYLVVNYLTYRDMKTEENRRDYMRDYMRKRRESEAVASGKHPVKRVKPPLAQLGHAEGELTVEEEAEGNGTQSAHEIAPPKRPPRTSTVRGRSAHSDEEVPELMTEAQAVAAALNACVPQDFALMVFRSWKMRDGKDGANVRVRWSPYVKGRFDGREGTQWKEGKHKEQNGSNGNADSKPDPLKGVRIVKLE
jgi:hypothetical protein